MVAVKGNQDAWRSMLAKAAGTDAKTFGVNYNQNGKYNLANTYQTIYNEYQDAIKEVGEARKDKIKQCVETALTEYNNIKKNEEESKQEKSDAFKVEFDEAKLEEVTTKCEKLASVDFLSNKMSVRIPPTD